MVPSRYSLLRRGYGRAHEGGEWFMGMEGSLLPVFRCLPVFILRDGCFRAYDRCLRIWLGYLKETCLALNVTATCCAFVWFLIG